MILDEKIIECELEYTKCFSEFYATANIVRFHDNQIKDMYYHNYTYIKKAMDTIDLKDVIQNEITHRLSEKSNFCNLQLNFTIGNYLLEILEYKPEVSINGYYSFDISYLPKLNALSDVLIKKVENQEMIDNILFCDLQHDASRLGKDFCIRRCYRRGKVYLSNEGVNSYVCYHNGDIIGNCDMFIYNGIAKIEDFSVLPKYQRKGYGTTILKSLIDIALKELCNTIYLVTDEDDTAKEMYKKIGFNKIGERTDLFFKL